MIDSYEEPSIFDVEVTSDSLTARPSPTAHDSLTDRDSPADRDSPTDRDGPTDRDDPTDRDGPIDRDSPIDRDRPTAQDNPTERANPTDEPSNNDQDSTADLPSIVVQQDPTNRWLISLQGSANILREPAFPDDEHEASESRSSQSSDTYTPNDTYVTPFPRHLANLSRLGQAQGQINSFAEISNLLHTTEAFINRDIAALRHIAHRQRQRTIREDIPPDLVTSQESGGIASVSEGSNQSLPEANADTVEEPPAKVRKISSPVKDLNKSEDTDGETCPICLDTWGNFGGHRLVALKCGHLFGAECVERWLKAQASNNRTCPTCKTKASLKDLRCIYARKLIAADNSEITRLQKQVEMLQTEKSRTELKLRTAKMTQRSLIEQLEDLKKTMSKMQSHSQPHVPKQDEIKSYRFALEKNLEISKDGACRVMAYNCRTYDLNVSQKSTNNLFPGFGIRKVSMVDYSLGQFIHLHPKPIRDVKYSQPNDLLLSVSLDKTARIVERGVPSVTVHVGFPLWSCAWDHQQINEFYVGGVGGEIHHYDLRFPGTILYSTSAIADMSPVVSLDSNEFGLLSCQLNSCRLWEFIAGRWIAKLFPVTGSFTSMCYDAESRNVLVSMRPRSAERSKLTLCSLNPTPRDGAFIEVEKFISGSARTSVLSRATFCKTESSSWVAAHSESDATLYLHGLDGSRTMSLPAADPMLDLCSLQVNSMSMLAALSESRLRIYKAVSC